MAASGILIFFSSVSLVTEFEIQNIEQSYENLIQQSYGDPSKVLCSFYFFPQEVEKSCVVPLVYTRYVKKGPYMLTLVIYGLLDDFIPEKAYLVVGEDETPIDIDRDKWRDNEAHLKKIDSDYQKHFSLNDQLDVDWDKLTDVKFIIEFTAIKDGKKTEYKHEFIYEKKADVWKGNFIFDAIMSV